MSRPSSRSTTPSSTPPTSSQQGSHRRSSASRSRSLGGQKQRLIPPTSVIPARPRYGAQSPTTTTLEKPGIPVPRARCGRGRPQPFLRRGRELLAAGEPIVRVQPNRMAQARSIARPFGTSDPIDARAPRGADPTWPPPDRGSGTLSCRHQPATLAPAGTRSTLAASARGRWWPSAATPSRPGRRDLLGTRTARRRRELSAEIGRPDRGPTNLVRPPASSDPCRFCSGTPP